MTSTSIGVPEGFQYNFITKSWTFLFTRTPDSGKTLHNGTKSNMQIDKDGNLIWHTYYSGSFNKIVKWNDSAGGGNTTPTGSGDSGIIYFRTKDFDFGNPAITKKIKTIIVSYSTAASGVNVVTTYYKNGKTTASGTLTNSWATAALGGVVNIDASDIGTCNTLKLKFAPAGSSSYTINDITVIYRTRIKAPSTEANN